MAEVDRNHDNVISHSEFNDAMIEVMAQRSSRLGLPLRAVAQV